MSPSIKRSVFWFPRIAGILFVVFISLFSLDVFETGQGFWETAAALFMHLLIPIALAAGVALAWRWEWVGAVIFCSFCLWYVLTMGGTFPILWFAPLLIGLSWAIGWKYREEIRMK